MNRKHAIVVGLLLLSLVLLIFWITSKTSAPKPEAQSENPQSAQENPASSTSSVASQVTTPRTKEELEAVQLEKRRKLVESIEKALSTSITFYGKVVDENGEPVPDAHVEYGLVDKFNASGSTGKAEADSKGLIFISGVRGAVISVSVYKEGYYAIQNVSNQAFAFGIGSDVNSKQPPTKDNPAVFVLQKKGQAEPLIQVSSRQFQIPSTGQPININLSSGTTSQPGLLVKSQVGKAAEGRYDWYYELAVAGGGLIERSGTFDFEAPQAGYQSSVKIEMKANDRSWKNGAEKSYFIKLANGTFARAQIRFYPSDYRNMIVLESYWLGP